MDGKKEGVSVKDIEDFARKHTFEVFFCALFVLACVFSFLSFFKAGWSILLATAGGVLSIIFPVKIDEMMKKMMQSVFKQDKTVQMVLGAVSLVIAIFLPPLVFLLLGLFGGRYMYKMAMDSVSK